MQLLEPMLAKPVKRLPTGANWWMEAKYDGWRMLAGILNGVVMWTRGGNLITQIPYIATTLLQTLPAGTIVDGEIVDLHGDRQWNRTQSLLTKTTGGFQHKPTPSDPALTYVLFDVLTVEGRDVRRLPLRDRRGLLEEIGDHLTPGLPVQVIQTHQPTDEGLQAIVDLGYEGVVCKRDDSTYRCGIRSPGWVKIKPNETIDAECIGTYEATPGSRFAPIIKGRPAPWAVGGIRFRVCHEDGRVYEGRAAGMDDKVRAELWGHPERFVGRVVEMVHWGIHDGGALRSPQCRRFRDPADKPATALPAGAARRQLAAPRPREPKVSEKPWMRNYAAMGPANVLASVESLRSRQGPAYERCVNAGGDPVAHLAAAEKAARAKNLL